jgi:nucleotide-binding universal stress UspA family protein
MRVFLAIDGSTSADRALDLTAGLPWPQGTVIRLITSVDQPVAAAIPPTLVPSSEGIDEFAQGLRARGEATLDAAEARLARPGLVIERHVLRGRPCLAIVDEAATWAADLIVLGSRGHSRIASMLLGSTSAEVVDHAPCPVLVVRDAEVSSVVLAADGSPGAQLAEHVLTDWPVFKSRPISVITVGPPSFALETEMPSGFSDAALDAYVSDVEEARTELERIAESSVARLAAAGLKAASHVRTGSPAREILEFALGRPQPLLVLGSRGLGPLARVVLGSVARNVLYHAPGSVLIVRRDVKVWRETPLRERVPVAS